MESKEPVICDSGTGYLKIGRADDIFPRETIPAMVGRPMLRYDQKIDNIELKSTMVGDEAAPYRAMLELTHPVQEGIVKDWDDMQLVWEYGFKKIGCTDYNSETILMTEAVMNPINNRIKMAEVLFEKFGFGRMQVGIQALLSLFAEGLMTALLVDAGDGVTHCIPVFDGFMQKHAVKRMNCAGRHVTTYMTKLLQRKGYAFNGTADFELVREIKEQFCFVSGDLGVERKLARETTIHEKEFRLPDGNHIKLGDEIFEGPELIFNPFLDGMDYPGVSQLAFDAIMTSQIDIRKSLYGAIMISGGTSMFPGFPTRLENDVKRCFRELTKSSKKEDVKMKINIIDPPRRKFNVFIGGGVLAKTMASRPEYWISKKDYDEQGAEFLMKNISDSLAN